MPRQRAIAIAADKRPSLLLGDAAVCGFLFGALLLLLLIGPW